MADCSQCGRPLGRHRWRCKRCGACQDCCDCGDDFDPLFDADELGLDPETFDLMVREREARDA
jgi:hypothetical protein